MMLVESCFDPEGQSWSTILDALSAHRTVIAIDLPGHGATPADHDSGTFDTLVALSAS